MEEYFSVYKAKNRARIHGTSCDILSLIDRFSMEKVHHKFCKSVLEIKKTSSNIAATSELGRLPLDTFIKTQVILCFSRINCKEINPFVQEAFKLNKTLSQDGIHTWYTFAREILAEFDINEEDLFVLDKPFKLFKNPIKNSTKRVVKEIILEKLSNLDEHSKLFLYNKLQNEIKLEDYLSTLKIFNSRQILTKFRISDHKLEIEIGRYKKVPREQRICKVLDDEKHFFLHCHINCNIRNSLIQEIENYYPDFNQLDSIAKLQIILNPSQDILSNVVDYIKQSMELRK
jgi:hypothetical protein